MKPIVQTNFVPDLSDVILIVFPIHLLPDGRIIIRIITCTSSASTDFVAITTRGEFVRPQINWFRLFILIITPSTGRYGAIRANKR